MKWERGVRPCPLCSHLLKIQCRSCLLPQIKTPFLADSERAFGYQSCAPLAHLPEALIVSLTTLLPELAPFPFGCAAGRLLRCHRAGPSTSLDKKCFIYLCNCAPNGSKCRIGCQKRHGADLSLITAPIRSRVKLLPVKHRHFL